MTADQSNGLRYFPFRPLLQGPFAQRFHRVVKSCCASEDARESFDLTVSEEVAWALSYGVNPQQRRVYRAVWMLLRDLVRIGWSLRWTGAHLELAPPPTDPSAKDASQLASMKQRVRDSMLPGRLDRLAESREFVLRMETPSLGGIARMSVLDLLADGAALSSDLHEALELSGEPRLIALAAKVEPYLQLVTENGRCEHTGHRLGDIWRYFRLTWASPAENTPGRTLLYLVRDRARPLHPVMGIASLENAPLRLAARDDYLGWTKEAFRSDLMTASDDAERLILFHRLLRNISEALAETDCRDLCDPSELDRPTDEVLRRLAAISSHSAAEREQALVRWRSSDAGDERSELGNISSEVEEHLYRRKRADQLGRLLSARQQILNLTERPTFNVEWLRFANSEAGSSSIWAALVAAKNRHVGTSILELNVCGAVPPYNEILGGKLVALLMLSPQVVEDYRARYGSRPSEIASRMRGAPVVRPAELVYIGTSSLYRAGSSQYNRLVIPSGSLDLNQSEVRWSRLGETRGFGTLHISRATLQALEEATDPTNSNHAFGEGASIKFRTIRHALDKLFEPGQREITEEVTRHAMSRIVYGAFLASNGRDFLGGKAEQPKYYFGAELHGLEGTRSIVRYWTSRWLCNRIENLAVLGKISTFDRESVRLSRALPSGKHGEFMPIQDLRSAVPESGQNDESWISFVRGLYRGSSGQADRTSDADLKRLHVHTRFDDAVLAAIREGKSVILTGNPGDGKTHLLRVLEPEFSQIPVPPLLALDASAITDAELVTMWRGAVEAGRPFAAAINQAVLFSLAEKFADFEPLRSAVGQVSSALSYVPGDEQSESVIVFDLSRRNPLSREVVRAVINRITDPEQMSPCALCPNQTCDAMRNARLIRTSQFQERLAALFDLVTAQGHHATVRELQAFVSYMLFGGRDCHKMLMDGGLRDFEPAQLVFSGKGRLFELLNASCDPATCSHPVWDERLISAEVPLEGWDADADLEPGSFEPDNLPKFESRKRAFYFFHSEGGICFQLSDSDERSFLGFLGGSDRDALRGVIKRINLLFGDADELDGLWAWQSHRFDQSPRRVVYAATRVERTKLEVARPRLSPTMARAFDYAADHLLVRLRVDHTKSLKVDFAMFQLLMQAERGVPTLSLPTNAMRRLWHFLEQLDLPFGGADHDDVSIRLRDLTTGDMLEVNVDVDARKLLSIEHRGENRAD